ncbi:GumC family protein [Echinimonas agarilytica]|uniref:non-specific protein-tyrosine kinase n=1 Tax=Echinimonas agarilytica TaxID=1215918 RepID=A0AA42B5Z0_9GAMM|nr:polysaccharide biosynthesis tyrosine autokinase [Echinimonas agarilytica]MCM2678217.1 polysaccharide biosynthesis tyrosine autokinase [Echinimonas agarilytica]
MTQTPPPNHLHSASATAQEDEIDLRALLVVIFSYKWHIAFFCALSLFAASYVAGTIKPTYRSSATLLLNTKEAQTVSIDEVYGLDSGRSEYFQTQFEIIKSRSLANKVIARLDLPSHDEFSLAPKSTFINRIKSKVKAWLDAAPQAPPPELPDYAKAQLQTNIFMSKLAVSPIAGTQIVTISFDSHDPELAALVVNTLGDIFIESHFSDKLGMTQKASGWLRLQLNELTVALRESELKLQTFREHNNLIDTQGIDTLSSQELNELTTQLSQARQVRTEAKAVIRLLELTGKTDVGRLMSMPAISKHQLILDIKRDENNVINQLAELSKRYGPKHNRIIATKARLKELQANLSKRVTALVAGIEQDYQSAINNEKALQKELEFVKGQFQGLAKVDAEYRVLHREVQTNRELYDTFLTRIKEMDLVDDFEEFHARFNDRAEIPLSPIKPKKALIVVLAGLLSGMVAVMTVLLFEGLSERIKTEDDLSLFGTPIIAIIPKISIKRKATFPIYAFFDAKYHTFSEAFRTLRSNYILANAKRLINVVAITSTEPGEGKTATATNMSFSLAQVEKVLLIEADMRRPTLAQSFSMQDNHPGLSNLLRGTHRFSKCIFKDSASGLDVIPAGERVANPLELLTGKHFKALLKRLSQHYDRIVIDTPPAHVVSDAMVVSNIADSIIYVVRANHVKRSKIATAFHRLKKLGIPIDGLVLNQVPEKEFKRYYGYQYDGYYNAATPLPVKTVPKKMKQPNRVA